MAQRRPLLAVAHEPFALQRAALHAHAHRHVTSEVCRVEAHMLRCERHCELARHLRRAVIVGGEAQGSADDNKKLNVATKHDLRLQ